MATEATKAGSGPAITKELAHALERLFRASNGVIMRAEEVHIMREYAATLKHTDTDHTTAVQELLQASDDWRSKCARVQDLLGQVPIQFFPYEGKPVSDTWPSQVNLHLLEMGDSVPTDLECDVLWFNAHCLPGSQVLTPAWKEKNDKLAQFGRAAAGLVLPLGGIPVLTDREARLDEAATGAKRPTDEILVDAKRWLEAREEADQGSDEHLQTLYVLTQRLAAVAGDRGDFAGATLLSSCFANDFPPDLTSRARDVVYSLLFSAGGRTPGQGVGAPPPRGLGQAATVGPLATAIAMLVENSELSNKEIAEAIGVNPKTLNKPSYAKFQAARAALKEGRQRGFKTKNGDFATQPESDDPEE